MERSTEHAVAKQFYPEPIRRELRDRLRTVPSHRRCNSSVKTDEEYFYHRFAALVMARNESIRSTLLQDMKRRAKKPQTRVMLRHNARGMQEGNARWNPIAFESHLA